MYLASSPTAAPSRRADAAPRAEPAALGLRISKLRQRTFGAGTGYRGEPMLEEYLTDMTRLYGTCFRRDRYAAANRNSFTQMAAAVVNDLAIDGPVDLIVIAHLTPDADPRRSAACYLAQEVSGAPLSFAVSDHGVLAPFTALRVAADYMRGPGAERALLLFLDQSTLPYETTMLPQLVPAEDVAVALLLEPAGPGGGLTAGRRCGIAAEELPAALETALVETALVETALVETALVETALVDEMAPLTIITGQGLDPLRDLPPIRGEVLPSPPGMPCTGAWSVLARRLAGWPADGRRVLLADYDRSTRDLGFCVVSEGMRP